MAAGEIRLDAGDQGRRDPNDVAALESGGETADTEVAGGRAGAEALIDLADRYGLRRVDRLLSEWNDPRGLSS